MLVTPAGTGGWLTAREREVAIMIARGLSNRQIADALVVVEGTAANHAAHILRKLARGNWAPVAAWSVCNGLLKDERLPYSGCSALRLARAEQPWGPYVELSSPSPR